MLPNEVVTLTGVAGASYIVATPAPIEWLTPLTFYPLGNTVVSLIDAAMAAGTLTAVNYDGSPLPAPAPGTTGYLVDTVSGAAITEPSRYSAIADLATGPTTILASLVSVGQVQSIFAGLGPVDFTEQAGSGTVLGGGAGSLFTLDGGAYVIKTNGGNDTIQAVAGTQDIELANPGNVVFLGAGSDTVVSGFTTVDYTGDNTIIGSNGTYSITAAQNDVVTLGRSNASINAWTGASIFGGSGNATVTAYEGGILVVNQTGRMMVSNLAERPVVPPYYNPDRTGMDVFGGSGSLTVRAYSPGQLGQDDGGNFPSNDVLVGGSAGHNLIVSNGAGDTIVGGGDGDILAAPWYFGAFGLVVAGAGAAPVTTAFYGDPNYGFKPGSAGFGTSVIFGGTGPDLILTSAGPSTVVAGTGADTIITGTGTNITGLTGRIPGAYIWLGSGPDRVQLGLGNDTVVGGTGAATIGATANALAFGGGGTMLFLNGTWRSTVFGAGGAVTVNGGTGSGVFRTGGGGGELVGGSAGGNVLVAGAGASTLFAGGSGDALYAGGGAMLVAGSGNESLSGGNSTGADLYFAGSGSDLIHGSATGKDTIYGGSGSATMFAGTGTGGDIFGFQSGHAGGSALVEGFSPGRDAIALQGYAAGTAQFVLGSAVFTANSTTLTLPDGTHITLAGIPSLSAASLI